MLKTLKAALAIIEGTEWHHRHAAENTYCPYCCTDAEAWEDQKSHHAGCQWVETRQLVIDAINRLEDSNG